MNYVIKTHQGRKVKSLASDAKNKRSHYCHQGRLCCDPQITATSILEIYVPTQIVNCPIN